MKVLLSEKQYKLLVRIIKESSTDVPEKKADLVKDDTSELYSTLESAAKKGGLEQQSYGDMTYQKEVESLQIGLILLGYELPRYGVDGLFGPETAEAVDKFIKENLKEDEKKVE